MMSGMGMMGGMGDAVWTINGTSMTGDGQPNMPPLFTLRRGQTCVLLLRNDTASWHPMRSRRRRLTISPKSAEKPVSQPSFKAVTPRFSTIMS